MLHERCNGSNSSGLDGYSTVKTEGKNSALPLHPDGFDEHAPYATRDESGTVQSLSFELDKWTQKTRDLQTQSDRTSVTDSLGSLQ